MQTYPLSSLYPAQNFILKFLTYLCSFKFVSVRLMSYFIGLFVPQIMSIISVLSLRSPENAARAIEAGAGDLAIQAMQKFPAAHQMQRNSCLMIRNLVVRNAENRRVCNTSCLQCIIFNHAVFIHTMLSVA